MKKLQPAGFGRTIHAAAVLIIVLNPNIYMKKNRTPREIPYELRKFARLMDTQFNIRGFRFGLDPILGLIPGIGDFISMLLSGGFVALAARRGISGKLIILMSLNLFIDAVVGSIPIFGQIFDFFYKANVRNIRLLEKYYNQGKYRGSGKGVAILLIILLLVVAVIFIYLILMLVKWIVVELNL